MPAYFFDIVDQLLTSLINEGAGFHPVVDSLMVAMSAVAVPLMVLAVAAQWWLCPDRLASRYAAIVAGLSFMLGLGFNQFILLFVSRPRPYTTSVSHLLVSPSADPSFPSDHATAAFAIALTYVLLGRTRTGAAFMVLATLVAISRVYLGVHYVGDVLGGMATGLIAVIAVLAAYRPDTSINRKLTSIM
jgi:undecaprenyl-diphosphatase